MAVRTKSALTSQVTSLFASGKTPRISAADARSILQDLIDSLSFDTAVDALETRIADLEAAGSGAATLLDLTDTPDSYSGAHGKILKVNAAEDGVDLVNEGGAVVSDHTRYALLTATSTIPTAAEFLAGFTSDTEEITVDAYLTAMYLHFADIHDQLTTIQQTTSQFNGRAGFGANPTALAINSVDHYVYSSIAARNPVGARTWRLVP